MGRSPAGPENSGSLGLPAAQELCAGAPQGPATHLHLLDTKAVYLLLSGHLSGPLPCCLPAAKVGGLCWPQPCVCPGRGDEEMQGPRSHFSD